MRRWHGLVGGAVLLGILAFLDYQNRFKTFRYRMTVEVDSGGKVHSAYSIIEANYAIGYDGLKRWNSSARGVASVIDLGPRGTVLAALGFNVADYAKRQKRQIGEWYRLPLTAADIPLWAYQVEPGGIGRAEGKVVLEKKFPNFIWIPPDHNAKQAKQVWPEDFQREIDPSVQLVQVTVEPAPDAKLITQIEPAPNWLAELKIEQPYGACTTSPDTLTICYDPYIERKR